MREIKFRAWDIDKKIFIPTEVYAIITTDFNAFGIMLYDWEDYKKGEYFYSNAQILSQYTGLKDKNGVEIFENDIVLLDEFTIDFGDYQDNPTQQVVFEYGKFQCKYECFGYEGERLINLERCEVIGNIFENPELLTQ